MSTHTHIYLHVQHTILYFTIQCIYFLIPLVTYAVLNDIFHCFISSNIYMVSLL